MARTPEQQRDDDEAYAAAYDEPAEKGPVRSEDEAFGIGADEEAPPDEATGGAAQADAEAVPAEGDAPDSQTATEADGDEAGTDADGAPRDDGGAADGVDGAAADAAEEGAADTLEQAAEVADSLPAQVTTTDAADKARAPMTEQQLRSWEGRLRKLEQQLLAAQPGKPKEQVAADAIDKVGSRAEAKGDMPMADAASEIAEQVESGELSVKEAMARMSEDFGEDFVRMITTIASGVAKDAGGKAAEERVGDVRTGLDEVIASIQDSAARTHFETIQEAHPDFEEVGHSEGFKAFVEGRGEAARQVVLGGTARQINRLLGDYKAQLAKDSPAEQKAAEKPAADPVVEQQMDDAEGVRSSGMRLPQEPKVAGASYEEAWGEF